MEEVLRDEQDGKEMRINIISGDDQNWILERAARELLPLGVKIGGKEGKADIDYYLPYCHAKEKHDNIQVGLFTHYEAGEDENSLKKQGRFWQAVKDLDYAVSMSERTAEVLGRSSIVIPMGSQFKREVVFGVCGKVYPNGRKNEQWVDRLIKGGFKVVAWGQGWPCPVMSSYTKDLPDFYAAIDYLIVTSSNEGGPVPVLEALSLGVPVIAPDVGWCWEYPVLQYERNNYESLLTLLKRLTYIPTWDDWRAGHRHLFSAIEKAGGR